MNLDFRNPNLSDLVATFYAEVKSNDRLRNLLTGKGQSLADVQIGQGCGSLTMQMSDARLSAMTASMAEEIMRIIPESSADGEIIIAMGEADNPSTTWRRRKVGAFTEVPIDGDHGWTFRLSPEVVAAIQIERAAHKDVETGGVLLGVCSARCRTITVVDTLPAPPDSTLSATRFVLGTQGLKAAIASRFKDSGMTIFDVGTWHSHLDNHGPSHIDRTTAAELAAQRPLPAALLIVCPDRYYGIKKKLEHSI